jgi:copper chaperone CopZ
MRMIWKEATMVSKAILVRMLFLGFVLFIISGCGESPQGDSNPTKVTLALGGEDCEFYLGAVEGALKKVKGVNSVDLKSQKHKAIVTTDGSLSPSKVAESIDGLSGEGWKCEAEVVN